MVVLANRVFETTTTQGTGTYSLAGAVPGHQTFVAGVGNGATVHYTVTDGVDWEVGTGVVTDGSPDTLSRGSILDSSNGGSAVNWGTGTRNVFIDIPAEAIMLAENNLSDVVDAATALSNLGALSPAGGTLTGNIEIEKASPKLILDRTSADDPIVEFQNSGSNRGGVALDMTNSRMELDYRSSGGVLQGQVRIGNGTIEFFDGTTSLKVLRVEAGSKAWWYQATAPDGWTSDGLNDFVLSVESAGGGSTAGSWTISGHVIVGASLTQAHLPALITGRRAGGSTPIAPDAVPMAQHLDSTIDNIALGSGDSHTHGINHSGTWRPARARGIICTVDA